MNKIMIHGTLVLFCMFVTSFLTALYISRMNMLEDIIWALPIVTVFSVMACFCLDYYQEERNKEKRENLKNECKK